MLITFRKLYLLLQYSGVYLHQIFSYFYFEVIFNITAIASAAAVPKLQSLRCKSKWAYNNRLFIFCEHRGAEEE